MPPSVAIVVPVLDRPHNVRPLLDSIERSTPEPHRTLFVCDPADQAEQAEIVRVGAEMITPGGTYAEKCRSGIQATSEPYIMLAADDLAFLPGWFAAARAAMRDGAEVVGVNDLIDRRGREHATHFLLTRHYAEMPTIDGGPGPLHTGYAHNFPDNELIATARHRGVYAYAPDAHVRHDHPMTGRIERDATYRKGDESFQRDRAIFKARRHLWAS